ncbi:hypothetical protein BH20ACI3_BH20ACI3_25070 [soil metagenome]
MGTVNYMSPEQAMGREVDHRTDLFSLGVALYEMATGRVPFSGASLTETIARITHAQPEAIACFNYDVPAELEVIIKKALRKNRGERYQTAHEMLIDLRDSLTNKAGRNLGSKLPRSPTQRAYSKTIMNALIDKRSDSMSLHQG